MQGLTCPCKIPHKERKKLVMKKVISALTVAAMCASMSASVMPAFAINAADAEFYLKAAKADKGTISADGATITFASAADAKGAKITIQEFIKADTAEPYVQQILSGFRVKDGVKSIKLDEAGVDYNGTVGDEKTYKIGDAEIDTDMFVSCFSTIDEYDEFDSNVKQFMWGHSNNWGWKDTYDGGDTLNLIWAQPNGAKFNSDKSDTYPFTEFYATIGDDIKDGTYTIEIFDTWDNLGNTTEKNPKGTVDGSTISDGKTTTKVTNTKNLTIVVGDASATEETTEKPTEKPTEATEKPTEATEKPTEATEKPTEAPSGKQSLDDKKNSKEWTWYFDDVTYDPAADTKKLGAAVTAYVTKDQGTYGYEFTPLINGKSLQDAGWTIKRAKQDKNGYNFSSFDFNTENGHLGGASQSKDGDTTLADGTAVVVLNLLPGDSVGEGVYEVSFKDLTVGNFKDVKSTPASIAGSITIGNPKPTEATEKPTEATEKPTEATEKPTEATEKPTENQDTTQSLDDKKNSKEWTWYFDDVTYDPAADEKKLGAAITAYVTKDQGTYGYEFTPLIDGKSLQDAGWTIKRAKQDKNGYNFSSFDFNTENGHLGGASQSKDGDTTLADGTAVVVLNLLPGDSVKEGVYKVSFKDLTVGNFKDVKSTPASIAGTITIGNPKPTEATEATDKTTEKPTEKPTEATQTPVGDYLYGDVNEDGKVELIDVVKLNRFITGVDKELSDKAKEQGNCYRLKADEATLDGSDSVEILRYLIGLVTKLSAEPQSK
jgi:hypothetical protein